MMHNLTKQFKIDLLVILIVIVIQQLKLLLAIIKSYFGSFVYWQCDKNDEMVSDQWFTSDTCLFHDLNLIFIVISIIYAIMKAHEQDQAGDLFVNDSLHNWS